MPRNMTTTNVRDFTADQDQPTIAPPLSPEDLDAYVKASREMLTLKRNKTALLAREKELNGVLSGFIVAHGEPTGSEGQHRAIRFPSPIRGFAGFIRQAKVSTGTNVVQAEAIARRKGLYERLFKPVPTLDESEVMVARAEGLLTDDELAEMFPRSTVHSLVPEKAK